MRGKLIREQDYRNSDSGYSLVREKVYTYRINFDADAFSSQASMPYPNVFVVPGYRVSNITANQSGSQVQAVNDFRMNQFNKYYYVSASVYLTKTVETLFDTQQNSHKTTTLLDYNNTNLLANRERVINSSGDTLIRYTHYLLDSTSIPSGTSNARLMALKWQQRHHVLNRPIEVTRNLYRQGQPVLALPRSLTQYQIASGIAMPLREYASQGGPNITVPISYIDVVHDSLAYDASYYPLVAHQRYDLWGNILQQRLPSGRPVAYQYGYRKGLLTAHAANASYQQIAFTSFEPGATGRWQYDTTRACSQLR